MRGLFYDRVIFLYKGSRFASSGAHAPRRSTINDMIMPHGSWKEHYNKRQKVYNAQLIAGITILCSTLLFVRIDTLNNIIRHISFYHNGKMYIPDCLISFAR